ncbi:unnamed protein product [Rodentolepis nana]|uniref:Palmitoyltransferase n=1 Tax=Rodentolepis nana TaxID=102285 RepID=A0A0R3TQY3_RODNA|nr:unnamed protein product [Rodentolepis nana]
MYLSLEKNKFLNGHEKQSSLYVNPIFRDARLGLDTLLHHAALGNAFKVVVYLDALDLNLSNAVGQTPFFSACQSGSFEAAASLLHRCKDINEKSKINLTPVHLACKSGNVPLVTMLILCGAKLDIPDSDACLPLHYAAQCGGPNMCSLLLRFYPSAVEYQNSKKNSPLHIACENCNMVSASTILRTALNPSFICFKISDFGSLATVLMKREFEVTLLNKDGRTPEHVAGSLGHFELASMIQYELYKGGKDRTCSNKPNLFSLMSYPICGYPGRRRAMFFWMFAISFGWIYPYLFFRISSSSVALTYNETIIFICLNIFLWVSFFVEVRKNSGYLPTNTVEYEEEMRELFAECRRLQNRTPLLPVGPITSESQKETLPLEVKALRRSIRILNRRLNGLCHTCGCVKPIRAKHCSLCNRCVRVMDHHCPVTDNCVGQDNR